MQGTTGKDLLLLTPELLLEIDISNPLHRIQLINRRDELVLRVGASSAMQPLAKAS